MDKLADYEDELRQLRAEQTPLDGSQTEAAISPEDGRQILDNTARASFLPIQSRLSSYLVTQKSTSNLQNSASPPSTSDLVAALTREQSLRQAAEGKLNQASGELEELSAQLFQQANEMVAAERKARAKLEARIEVLERRDVEKRKRLERLESAVKRIERVRALLAPSEPI